MNKTLRCGSAVPSFCIVVILKKTWELYIYFFLNNRLNSKLNELFYILARWLQYMSVEIFDSLITKKILPTLLLFSLKILNVTMKISDFILKYSYQNYLPRKWNLKSHLSWYKEDKIRELEFELWAWSETRQNGA